MITYSLGVAILCVIGGLLIAIAVKVANRYNAPINDYFDDAQENEYVAHSLIKKLHPTKSPAWLEQKYYELVNEARKNLDGYRRDNV